MLLGSDAASAQASVDSENRYPSVGAIMIWRVDGAGTPAQLVGFVSGTLITQHPDVGVTEGDRRDWALWSIPSYVWSGDSGGGIFPNARSDGNPGNDRLVANVSDGDRDCRRHNNNNRLDTRGIQGWIDETIRNRR